MGIPEAIIAISQGSATAAQVATVAATAATTTAVTGQMQAAETAKSQARYESAMLQRQAESEREAGIIKSRQMSREQRALTAQQEAAYAGAGISAASVSPTTVIGESLRNMEYDRLSVLRNARVAQQSSIASAGAARLAGSSQATAYTLNALGSGLSLPADIYTINKG